MQSVRARGDAHRPDYLPTLDGFRTLAAVGVMMFHYWQQSWNTMVLRLGSFSIDLTHIVSNGFLGVELLFLLSGFCLYWPLALHPERKLHLGQYVWKRACRILPTYLICVLICSWYQVGRMDPAILREQFIGNMTLTQMTTPALSYNRINGVLWSVAIEVQFYILFPLLIRPFRRWPYRVMLASFIVAEIWRWYLRDIDHSQINYLMNQLPGMIDCFVGGMLAAHVAAAIRKGLSRRQLFALRPAFSAGLACFLLAALLVMMYIDAVRYNNLPDNLSRVQMNTRKFVVAAFGGAVLSSLFAGRLSKALLGNRLMRFGSGISYQLYLWHMWIALRLKDFHLPPYATERPMDDPGWRFPYMMLSIALSLAVAVAMTYLVEKPIARALLSHPPKFARPKAEVPRPDPAPERADP